MSSIINDLLYTFAYPVRVWYKITRKYFSYGDHLAVCKIHQRQCQTCKSCYRDILYMLPCIITFDIIIPYLCYICFSSMILIIHFHKLQLVGDREFSFVIATIFLILIIGMADLYLLTNLVIIPPIYMYYKKYNMWRDYVFRDFQIFVLMRRLRQIDNDLLDYNAAMTAIGRFI